MSKYLCAEKLPISWEPWTLIIMPNNNPATYKNRIVLTKCSKINLISDSEFLISGWITFESIPNTSYPLNGKFNSSTLDFEFKVIGNFPEYKNMAFYGKKIVLPHVIPIPEGEIVNGLDHILNGIYIEYFNQIIGSAPFSFQPNASCYIEGTWSAIQTEYFMPV